MEKYSLLDNEIIWKEEVNNKTRFISFSPERDLWVIIENGNVSYMSYNDFEDYHTAMLPIYTKEKEERKKRELEEKRIQDFINGKVYTKYSLEASKEIVNKIKELPYTIFNDNYKRKGLHKCPFHNDSTPSMSIRGKWWRCFGCNEGGSIIDFYMKLHGVDFKTAVQEMKLWITN